MIEQTVSAVLQRVVSDPGLATLLLLGVAVVLAAWLLLVVRGIRRDVCSVLEAIEAEIRSERQEAAEHQEAALRKLGEIAARVGQALPPHVRVESISAENLVVSPGSNGKRPAQRPRTTFDEPDFA